MTRLNDTLFINRVPFKFTYDNGTRVDGISYQLRVQSTDTGNIEVYTFSGTNASGAYQTEELTLENGVYRIEVFQQDAVFLEGSIVVDTTGRRSGTTIDSSYFGGGL